MTAPPGVEEDHARKGTLEKADLLKAVTIAREYLVSTGRDMAAGKLSEAFNEEWSVAVSEAALRGRRARSGAANTGKVLVAAYLAEAAPAVNPRAIEQSVQAEIDGIRGIVDLLDVDGCVFDFKTSSKKLHHTDHVGHLASSREKR